MPRRLAPAGNHPTPGKTPGVSIVLAVYDPPLAALTCQLEAIDAQTSSAWECIVVDDASTRSDVIELLRTWVGVDPTRRRLIERPSNGGIAAATNDGIDAAIGDIITICDHDDVIHPTAIAHVLDHFDEHPEDDVVYTDEQVVDSDGRLIAKYAKPAYSPRRHLGHHYLNHLVAARRDAVGDIRVRGAHEPCQDFDFYLRVIEAAERRQHQVGHIAKVLYSWRAITGSSALNAAEKPEMTAAVERCVQAALDRRNVAAEAHTVWFDGQPTTAVRLGFSDPTPTVDVIAVDASTTPSDVNQAVAASDASVVVLSPDPSRFDFTWATPLAVEAMRPDVGVIGPVVVNETNGNILSVGRVVQPMLDDPFAGDPAESAGPWGAFFVTREVSALAPWGATFERASFDAVGGLSGDVGLDVAVAELCVRLADLGQSALWSPASRLTLSSQSPLVTATGSLLSIEQDRRTEVAGDLRRATKRTPALAIERYSLIGLAHLSGEGVDAYRSADILIRSGAVDLVTSDVFDTLVTRSVATPSDLFVQLAASFDLPQHVTPAMFALARREAEHQARQQRSDARRRHLVSQASMSRSAIEADPEVEAPECTLNEIWSLMPVDWVGSADGAALELELEASALEPIPEAVELFRTANEHDVPVVLVSDIYLTSSQLSTVLEHAGVDLGLIDALVTSADHRLGKAQGLLAQVITERGVAPERVAHVGDNEIADVATAADLGAKAIHVDVPTINRHVILPPMPLRRWSRSVGTDLGISAAVRSALVGAGPLGLDPSFQFGTAVAGPALAGFGRWVSDTTTELGATATHCMLREGATIAELMQLTAPNGPTPVPLHVSRWVTMRAAVIDGTVDELVVALARRADLSAQHVADAFGCDEADVRRVIGAARVDSGRLIEACAALSADDALRSTIVASSASLRSRVTRYLHQRLRLEDGAPIVLADVGWGGTIQEGLTRILRAEGIDNEVVGLYLALSSPGEQRLARGARMLSYLPNESDDPQAARHSRAIAHHADTIERIMTPETGTLIDIDEDGSPVCRDASDDPLSPTLASAQRGIRDVTVRLAAPSNGLTDLTDPRWSSSQLRAAFAEVIADAITAPSRPLAEALGAWPHDDVAGTGHRSIAGSALTTAVRYANVRDVERLDPAGRNWIGGIAAAVNPTLSAHLQAARSGVPLDRLAPDGENGIARLAAFEVGSDLATVQVGHHVSVAPAGWSVLRLAGPVESLRSIRFDAGEHEALVDIDHFGIRLSTVDGLQIPERDLSLDDDDITWVDAHPVDQRRFAQQPGGHLLINISAALAPTICFVEVTAAFRSWRLEPGSPLAKTPILHRVDNQRRRIHNAVRRRLG